MNDREVNADKPKLKLRVYLRRQRWRVAGFVMVAGWFLAAGFHLATGELSGAIASAGAALANWMVAQPKWRVVQQ